MCRPSRPFADDPVHPSSVSCRIGVRIGCGSARSGPRSSPDRPYIAHGAVAGDGRKRWSPEAEWTQTTTWPRNAPDGRISWWAIAARGVDAQVVGWRQSTADVATTPQYGRNSTRGCRCCLLQREAEGGGKEGNPTRAGEWRVAAAADGG